MYVSILYAHVYIHVCMLKACAATPGCKLSHNIHFFPSTWEVEEVDFSEFEATQQVS